MASLTKSETKKYLDRLKEMSDEDIKINGDFIRLTAESAYCLIKQWEGIIIKKRRQQNQHSEKKKGHWIPYYTISEYTDIFTCSCCKNNTTHPYPTENPDEYLFCPYCGAEMTLK